jgi:di/tricarboxylate transporter
MTTEQVLVISVFAATLAGFALGRFRPEIVALTALAAGAGLGLVGPGEVFSGFTSPAVLTVIQILMLAQLLQQSGLVDRVAAPMLARVKSERGLLVLLTLGGGGLSIFINNAGALAIMLPLAYAGCRQTGTPVKAVLMPLSFATLLGGMCSLIGTPANLVLSGVHADAAGVGLGFFTFAVAGAPALAVGAAYMVWRARRASASAPEAEVSSDHEVAVRSAIFEVMVPPGSGLAGKSLSTVEIERSWRVHHVVREERFLFARREGVRLQPDDLLVVEAARSSRPPSDGDGRDGSDDKPGVQERDAVVTAGAVIVGSSIGSILAFEEHGVEIVAVRSAHPRVDGRLGDMRVAIGDVLTLRGDQSAIAHAIDAAGCLPLIAPDAEASPPAMTPFAGLALAGGVLAAAFGLATPEIAFGVALLVMAMFGAASLPELLRRVDWGVIIMLAALIPLAGAFEASGAARALASPILAVAPDLAPLFVIAATWLLTALITPFLNNVATAAVMGPIAVAAAGAAALPAEALLLAVAVGASSDFLTPYGHHNNAIVMGAADYRLRDFVARGWPVILITGGAAITSISFWYS